MTTSDTYKFQDENQVGIVALRPRPQLQCTSLERDFQTIQACANAHRLARVIGVVDSRRRTRSSLALDARWLGKDQQRELFNASGCHESLAVGSLRRASAILPLRQTLRQDALQIRARQGQHVAAPDVKAELFKVGEAL